MKKTDKHNLKAHLFICCREREGKPACGNENSLQMVENIKTWIKTEGLKSTVKCSSTSCLSHCEEGIAACLYPQNQWFTELSLSDEEALKNLLLAAAKL